MKSKQGNPPEVTPKLLSRAAGAAVSLAESCAPLWLDFPDPVLIADRDRRVVFLNRAAVKIFGEALRPGTPVPSAPAHRPAVEPDGTVHQSRCLEPGESLKRPRCC